MKLAIFDFDGTLFKGETVPFIFIQYGKLGYPRTKQAEVFLALSALVIKYKLSKKISKELFRQRAVLVLLRLFKGMNREELDSFFAEISDEILASISKDVYKELNEKKSNGYKIVILSGCFENLLNCINKNLNADLVVGTKLNFKDSDLLDLKTPLTVVTGVNKPIALTKILNLKDYDLANSIAYGDSIYDKHVFDLVGNSVAVNPDKKLRKLAKEDNLRIIEV